MDAKALARRTSLEVVVDRIRVDAEVRPRLTDAIEVAYLEGGGQAFAIELGAGEGGGPLRHVFSERFECRRCGIVYEVPQPRLFSFNNPFGACPTCHGFGNVMELDMGLVVPDPAKTLNGGAIEPWSKPHYRAQLAAMKRAARAADFRLDVPWSELTERERDVVLRGHGDFGGVQGFFQWLERKKYKVHIRVFLSRYRGYQTCPECGGTRLRREARDVRVAGWTIDRVCALTVREAKAFFASLELTPREAAIAEKVLREIRRRLTFLDDVGLDYLTLDRLSSTLSGGEAQRIQLATNLGSSLVGALYVLDEPSIGLHPRDSERLIKLLHNLRDIGNTVLVVEHDEEMMRAADHILDIGPAAGELGGRVIYEGDFKGLLKDSLTLTGKYLRGEAEIREPKQRRAAKKKKLCVRGAAEHNLRNIDVDIPLEMLVCVTGVSGSGKSTLVHDVIYAGLKKQRGEWQGHVGAFKELQGTQHVDEVILVDQSPIGRTPRSNPVTYIKVYDAIREVFSQTRDAQAKGFDPSHFSFNVPGGRCDVCEGDGTVTVEMQFLADVELVCEECKGTRFKPQILDVRYRGKSINDVLSMTVREAMTFFRDTNKIANRLRVLDDVGLGYLRLGQSATTLSGGEAQRVKLAAHLSKRTGSKTLYIFDEPTTGLHFDDINKLLAAFRTLVEAGGSLLVIEHNLDVIKTADHCIDLGPEGGIGGGHVIAQGTPEEMMAAPQSHTGRFLKAHLARSNGHHA
ncbi:MAG TPA: excinuclease ABC subunit UvrA [Pyrinomonadaceae bacterium]|nr:excinuclease ABC subunit UvrA [Pyrinomonadaceae bacterium]